MIYRGVCHLKNSKDFNLYESQVKCGAVATHGMQEYFTLLLSTFTQTHIMFKYIHEQNQQLICVT